MLTLVVLVRQNTVRSRLSQGGRGLKCVENSNRYTAIKNPNNPPGFNNFEFSNRYKSGFLPIHFEVLPAVFLTTSRRRCYLPTARAIQYPVIHTGDSNPA
jgi:hypothetical protein